MCIHTYTYVKMYTFYTFRSMSKVQGDGPEHDPHLKQVNAK